MNLAAAISAALSANPDAEAARQQFVQAQARLDEAGAQRRTAINFSSTAGASSADVNQPPPSRETFGAVQNAFTIPIPIGSRPRYAAESARQQLAAAQAEYARVQRLVASEVTSAYFDILRKQALRALAVEAASEARRQLDEAQKRFRAGDVPELDVLRSQVPVATADAAVTQADADLAIGEQTLSGLLGRPLTGTLPIADVQAPAGDLPFSPDRALTLALTASPEVAAADATVRANEASTAAARRYADPSLSVQAIDIRSSDATSFSREDTVQATVTVPLSDGGLGRAQIREAQAALAQARAQAQSARRVVEAAVGSAYITAATSRKRVEFATAARDIAATTYDKTMQGYAAGLYPLSDVLSAEATLNQARTTYTQAVYEAAAASAALAAITQATP
jgi:outer membrane protein TolC